MLRNRSRVDAGGKEVENRRRRMTSARSHGNRQENGLRLDLIAGTEIVSDVTLQVAGRLINGFRRFNDWIMYIINISHIVVMCVYIKIVKIQDWNLGLDIDVWIKYTTV